MRGTGANNAVLSGALKDLEIQWEIAASRWKDEARERFDKDFLQDLRGAVLSASNAIVQIEILLAQVRRECS